MVTGPGGDSGGLEHQGRPERCSVRTPLPPARTPSPRAIGTGPFQIRSSANPPSNCFHAVLTAGPPRGIWTPCPKDLSWGWNKARPLQGHPSPSSVHGPISSQIGYMRRMTSGKETGRGARCPWAQRRPVCTAHSGPQCRASPSWTQSSCPGSSTAQARLVPRGGLGAGLAGKMAQGPGFLGGPADSPQRPGSSGTALALSPI